MKSLFFRTSFLVFFGFSILFISLLIFNPIFLSNSIIFPYALEPFDICNRYPIAWNNFKIFYLFCSFLSGLIIGNSIYSLIFKKISFNNQKNIKNKDTVNGLSLILGKNNNEFISIPEKSLYQNILITGTIGCGKTSSAMYPFCKQLIEYEALDNEKKLGMLVLDVKGNFYNQVLQYAKNANRENDLILLELGGKYTYNPLDRPNLKASVLADRLKMILMLFSPNNTDDYWLDKSSQILAECIKLCRLYNNGYVTFTELHKLIFFPNYYESKLSVIKEYFKQSLLDKEDCFNLVSSLDFFENEFRNLDERVLSIVKSEISRITSMFISDYSVKNTFCPLKECLNFEGFKSVLNQGKIVILNMNIANYQNLAKFISAYLKLDFQSEVLNMLSSKKIIRPSAFICDEFHEFVTRTDANFFAQSREAKCINIVATQSYSSILGTIKDKTYSQIIIQNLINKLWYRTDDTYTIEEIQKLLGREEKEKISHTISENAKETNYHYLTNRFHSDNSSISESFNTYTQNDFIYDSHFFSQELNTFECLAFLSDGIKILNPCKLHMLPYFQLNTNERSIFRETFF